MLEKTYFASPLGSLEITGSEFGIASVKLVESILEMHREDPTLPILQACIEQLAEYFQGRRKEFDLKIDWGGAPAFYRAVWTELLKIPYGRTTTYSAIAEKVGQPAAVRAVGLANRKNPIAIVVPCHRVIAKSGDLQGYFYGLEVKRRLLELENPESFGAQGSLF